MTPEREAYLAKCSKWEKILRHWIKVRKNDIKRHKFELNNAETIGEPKNLFRLNEIRFHKDHLKCFRHELARLKGMDRVAVPSEQYDRRFETYNWYCTKCDSEISTFENCCSNCGRRILWEKVK
jgi:hypothetical protein